jgi:hypothetical protein
MHGNADSERATNYKGVETMTKRTILSAALAMGCGSPAAQPREAQEPITKPNRPYDGTHHENGVRVTEVKIAAWCASDSGMCWAEPAGCEANDATDCIETATYACTQARARTDGREILVCMSTYARCEEARNKLASTPETTAAACIIFRKAAK